MTRARFLPFALLGLAAAAGLGSLPARADDACLTGQSLYDWNSLDDRTLVVTNQARQKFKISLRGICQNMDWHFIAGIKSSSRLSCITRGDQVIIRRGFGIPTQFCPIDKVELYTAEMQKADLAAKTAKP